MSSKKLKLNYEVEAVPRLIQITLALLVPLALVLAWAGGQLRTSEAKLLQLQNISNDISKLEQVNNNLYKGRSRTNPQENLYIAHLSQPSYGGPLEVAAVVDSKKNIRYVAILSSSDTSSYLEKVVGLGILDAFVDQSLEQLPEVDAISRATLSSTAIIRGVENAVQQIGAEEFGMEAVKQEHHQTTPETLKLVTICLFFAAALVITSKKFKHKRKARTVLLVISVIVLGFLFGAQFSLSTVASLLNGSWLRGMATYATLLCLVLALLSFLVTRKNLFCTYICPFGAIQEGLGKITGCAAPVQTRWMVWVARSWVLVVLLAALYYQMPSYAMYEPFGKAFSFIGSGMIYSLTILVMLTSLMFKRPWCHLFCPTTIIISYFRFARKVVIGKPGGQKLQKLEEIE